MDGFLAGSISGVFEIIVETITTILGALIWMYMAGSIENGTRASTGIFKTAKCLTLFIYVLTEA